MDLEKRVAQLEKLVIDLIADKQTEAWLRSSGMAWSDLVISQQREAFREEASAMLNDAPKAD